MAEAIWKWPIPGPQHLAGTAGGLTFVGGAGDFNGQGMIRHPGDLEPQISGTISNLAVALAIEGCELADAIPLKVFYRSDGSRDEWEILAALSRHFQRDPLPAVTLHPVPLQPFSGQELQVQVIAIRNWRSNVDLRVVTGDVPAQRRRLFGRRKVTLGLRAGEFIAVAGVTAVDNQAQALAGDNGIEQTRIRTTSDLRLMVAHFTSKALSPWLWELPDMTVDFRKQQRLVSSRKRTMLFRRFGSIV